MKITERQAPHLRDVNIGIEKVTDTIGDIVTQYRVVTTDAFENLYRIQYRNGIDRYSIPLLICCITHSVSTTIMTEIGIFVRVKFIKYIGSRNTGGKSFYTSLNCTRNKVIYKIVIILPCAIKYFFSNKLYYHLFNSIGIGNGNVSRYFFTPGIGSVIAISKSRCNGVSNDDTVTK